VFLVSVHRFFFRDLNVIVSLDLVQSPVDADQQRETLSNLDFRSLPSVYQQALLEVQATSESRDDAA
jgi:hypothetical protein